MKRWLAFLLMIAVSLAAALAYGWFINPLSRPASGLPLLRQDYRTDYVLMVAEAYTAERDLNLARARLELLGQPGPQPAITAAMLFGAQNGYTPEDLELMRDLLAALESSPVFPTASPTAFPTGFPSAFPNAYPNPYPNP